MLSDFFFQVDDYLIYCKAKQLTKKTIQSYEQSLKLFVRYCEDIKDIKGAEKVKQQTILDYMDYVSSRGKYTTSATDLGAIKNRQGARDDVGKPVSDITINNYLRNIKAFFSYCQEYGITKSHPAKDIKLKVVARRAKEFMSDEKFNKLLKAFKLHKFVEYRDYIITNLLMDSGMRITECLFIKIKDIDIVRGAIFLPAPNTKGRKDRVVYFSNVMRPMLKQWLKYKDLHVESDYLFHTQQGNPISGSVYNKRFNMYCKRIGLEYISPHVIRNNFAKRFLKSGGDIYSLSKILGHSSVLVTEKIYLDLTDSDLRDMYQAHSPLINMRKNRRR